MTKLMQSELGICLMNLADNGSLGQCLLWLHGLFFVLCFHRLYFVSVK